jgi:hypothetical protein
MRLRCAFAVLLAISAAGCLARNGPYVTRITSPSPGVLLVTRCYASDSDGGRESHCRRQTINVGAPDPHDQQRAIAAALTQVASTAAQRGDCNTVKAIEPEVAAHDVPFHDRVFAADGAIATCLAPPPAASTTTAMPALPFDALPTDATPP